MHNEAAIFKPQDPGRVDLLDALERQYWTRELQCTEAQLVQAVAKVGTHVAALRDYLGQGH